ncbi:hypothetical protein diail_11237 [Diaporthe ilicicola]|nr:hypothetical protein diail_11237 [Diaporthe ilicicola]
MSGHDLSLAIRTTGLPRLEKLRPALETIKAVGIKGIDTAEMYGTNEADMESNPGGWIPSALANITKQVNASLTKLKTERADILYIHGPDRDAALDDWGAAGGRATPRRPVPAFRRFVLPSVYQDNYNAVSRGIEETLFPVLRGLGIAFYAHSPVAGGFLTKTRAALEEGTAGGRFSVDAAHPAAKFHQDLCNKPRLLEGLDRWDGLTELQRVPRAELAYRWVYWHSALRQDLGNVVIVGASRPEQIEQTVGGIRRGPLMPGVVKGIEEVLGYGQGRGHCHIVDIFEASGGKLPGLAEKWSENFSSS